MDSLAAATSGVASAVRVALLTGPDDRSYALGLTSSLVSRGIHVDFIGSDQIDGPELHGTPLVDFLNLRGDQRNVVPAMRIFLDDLGYELSRRRVTLSTSGLVPQMYKLAQECNVALAVSLHAPNDALRNELVPINRKHPIAELLEACWHYLDEQNGRSITFEYVMLDGINDLPEHARELAKLLRGRAAKLNLIPFNPFKGTRYRRSSDAAILRFRDILNDHGIIATIRRTRGDDIDAACGQLAGKVNDRTLVRLGTRLAHPTVSA